MAKLTITDVQVITRYLPWQWHARTLDNRPVYIRFKYGELSVNIGPVDGTVDDALDSPYWYDKLVADDHDDIDFEQVCQLTDIVVS